MTRDELVTEYRECERKTRAPLLQTLTVPQAKREYARKERLLVDYAAALPELPVSRCPVCGEVLRYAFDAQGLDGMWWCKDELVPTHKPLETHHRVVLGAIDFHGRVPAEAEPNGQVLPGPGAPFVIKRLLDMDGMAAVISSLALPQGDTAYLIAYFSEAPVNPFHLHQPWARMHLNVDPDDDPKGCGGWGMATDPWDFELQAWIDAGKLKWIEPGDLSLTLRDSGPCPYVNLPGVRAPQSIDMGVLGTLPPPDGRPFAPFD